MLHNCKSSVVQVTSAKQAVHLCLAPETSSKLHDRPQKPAPEHRNSPRPMKRQSFYFPRYMLDFRNSSYLVANSRKFNKFLYIMRSFLDFLQPFYRFMKGEITLQTDLYSAVSPILSAELGQRSEISHYIAYPPLACTAT